MILTLQLSEHRGFQSKHNQSIAVQDLIDFDSSATGWLWWRPWLLPTDPNSDPHSDSNQDPDSDPDPGFDPDRNLDPNRDLDHDRRTGPILVCRVGGIGRQASTIKKTALKR